MAAPVRSSAPLLNDTPDGEPLNWAAKFATELGDNLRYSTDPTSNYVYIHGGGDYRHAYHVLMNELDDGEDIFRQMRCALVHRLTVKIAALRPRFDAAYHELMKLPSMPERSRNVHIDDNIREHAILRPPDTTDYLSYFALDLLRAALVLDDVELVRQLYRGAQHCGYTCYLPTIFHAHVRSRVLAYAIAHPDELSVHPAHPILVAVREDNLDSFIALGSLVTLTSYADLLPDYGITDLDSIRRARAYLLLRGAYHIVRYFGLPVFAAHEAYTQALLRCQHMPLVEFFIRAEIAAQSASGISPINGLGPTNNRAAITGFRSDHILSCTPIGTCMEIPRYAVLDTRLLRPLSTYPTTCALYYLVSGSLPNFSYWLRLFSREDNWGKLLAYWWGTTPDLQTSCPGLLSPTLLNELFCPIPYEDYTFLCYANYYMSFFDFKLLDHRSYVRNLLHWVRTLTYTDNIGDVLFRYLEYVAQRAWQLLTTPPPNNPLVTRYIIPQIPFFCRSIVYKSQDKCITLPSVAYVRLLTTYDPIRSDIIRVNEVAVRLDHLFLVPGQAYTVNITNNVLLMDLDLGIIVPPGQSVANDGMYRRFVVQFHKLELP